MRLTELFSGLRQKHQQQVESAESQYENLVLYLADGKDHDTDDVDAILRLAGRSVEDLERDVELKLQRREWRAILDTEPKLTAQRGKLHQQIETERESFQRARSEHELAMAALNDQLADVDADARRLDDARVKLHESSTVSKRQGEIGTQQVRPLARKIDELNRRLRQEEAAVRQIKNREPERHRLNLPEDQRHRDHSQQLLDAEAASFGAKAERLRQEVARQPDATLDQLADRLGSQSIDVDWRAMTK